MIIYFSATGNSKYIAEQLAEDGERLIFIPDAVDQGNYVFTVEPDERVGIISPTCCWTLPDIVEDFLKKLKLKYADRPYVYYVGTFGTTTGAAATMADHILKANGLAFDAMFDVKMPDTWTPVFDLSDKERVSRVNREADVQIERLKEDVRRKTKGKHMHLTTPYFTGVIGKTIYDEYTRNTNHFTVESSCIGCGLCARKCPVHAIEIVNKHPVWIKEKCTMCLGCLHRCPAFAIKYGKNTEKHGQYTNPNVTV